MVVAVVAVAVVVERSGSRSSFVTLPAACGALLAGREEIYLMQLNVYDLLQRQVTALVSETADAIAQEGQNVLEIEADLYCYLAKSCAEKDKLASALRDRYISAPAA